MSLRVLDCLIIAALLPIAATGETAPKGKPAVAVRRQNSESIQIWSAFDIVKSGRGVRARLDRFCIGTATPVTADGYCLTAGHVVEAEPFATLHLRSSMEWPVTFMQVADGKIRYYRKGSSTVQIADRDAFRMSGVRVVYRFPKTDLAVVKVDFPTPNYFRTITPPAEGQKFAVSFNPYSHQQSSWLATTDHAHKPAKPDRTKQYWIGELSIPVREGDSGSPVVGPTGVLHGVLFEGYERRTWRPPFKIDSEPIARYLGVSNTLLSQVIERDRATRNILNAKSR